MTTHLQTERMTAANPQRRRRWTLPALLLALIAAGGAGFVTYGDRLAALWSAPADEKAASSDSMDKYHKVERGDFHITVLADGTLNPIKRHDLRCEAKGNFELRIVEVVEDKTEVKKDDLVIKFSSEKAEEQLEKLELELENTQRDLALSREDLAMRKANNRSSIKSALDKLRNVQEVLEKYRDLDAPRERKAKQAAIDDARAKLDAAEAELSLAKEAETESEALEPEKEAELEKKVKDADKKVVEAQRALDKANHDYRVFKQYDFPQKMRELKEAVVQARLNFRKACVDAKGKIIQAERQIQSHERRIESLTERIEKLREDIEKLEIRAPVDGIVTLGNPRRRHWQEPKEIKVGETVHSRQIIASIPDLSKFEVTLQIPEEYRSRVSVGLPAKLQSPAIPDLAMEGKIESIAPMASHIVRWDKNSPKVYDTKIETDTSDPRLMPGMTVKVEIVVETVVDVLFLPVEAAFNQEGRTLCRVRTLTGPEEREIETGRASIHYVEVTSGLEEGDEVLLSRRTAERGE